MRAAHIEPGDVFARWVAVANPERVGGRRYVRCRCACGSERLLLVANLTGGLSKSCGCLSREIQRALKTTVPPIYIGRVFGNLTVLGEAPQATNRKRQVRCLYGCGVECVRPIYGLLGGTVASCGCGTRLSNLRHGHAAHNTETREYRSWHAMINRCTNPNVPNWEYYGGRGIRVCDSWRWSFEQFLADVGARPEGQTLDRIDSDGHYEPGNVRWATPKEQARTRRKCQR